MRHNVFSHNTSTSTSRCVNQIPPRALLRPDPTALPPSLSLSFLHLCWRMEEDGPFENSPTAAAIRPTSASATISRKVARLRWYMTFLTVIIITVCARLTETVSRLLSYEYASLRNCNCGEGLVGGWFLLPSPFLFLDSISKNCRMIFNIFFFSF